MIATNRKYTEKRVNFLALLAMPPPPPKSISKRIKFRWATYLSYFKDLFDSQPFILSREC